MAREPRLLQCEIELVRRVVSAKGIGALRRPDDRMTTSGLQME